MNPVRLQLSRRKGFNLQDFSRSVNGLPAVMIARPSIFGNPFVIGTHGTAEECVAMFDDWLKGELVFDQMVERRILILQNLDFLRGRNLACWCKHGRPCHGIPLLRMANDKGKLI